MYRLSQRSKSRLVGVHPDLVKVVNRAIQITPYDFGISEGLRTEALQANYVATGKSTTHHSRHLVQDDGYGHAFDFYVLDEKGRVTWKIGYYRKVIQAMFDAAIELGVHIESGGLWKSFVDGPHIQLKRGYTSSRIDNA